MPYKLFFVLLSTTESEDRGQVVWGELSRGWVVWHSEMHNLSCFMHWGCSLVDPQLWQLLDNVMMKFIINNKTDTWKTDINLSMLWIICLVTLLIFVLTHNHSVSTKHATAGIPCFNQRCPSPEKWTRAIRPFLQFFAQWTGLTARLKVTLFWYRPLCFCCVNHVMMLTRCVYITKAERSVSKQGHLQACCHSRPDHRP